MNDFIFNFPPLKDTTILFGFPWDAFLPPLVGSFLGLIAGFGINYLAHKIKDYKDKNYYKNMLKTEVSECYERCERILEDIEDPGEINPLPIDRWTAAMNSGALRLFNADEVNGLSRIYYIIKKYNLVAENLSFIEANIAIHETEMEGRKLLDEIRERLTIDWLIPSARLIPEPIIKADEADAYWK